MLHYLRIENHKIKQPIMCSQVRKFLSHLDIASIAKSSNFVQRKARKVSPENFILSFLLIFPKSNFSFRQWASQLSILIDQSVSFQLISKRCSVRCLNFVNRILDKAIQMQLSAHVIKGDFMKQFGRVLLEDSTCFSLSRSMLKAFSGAGNHKSNVAMCKSHYCYNLLTMETLSYKITKINVNDAAHSAAILEHLKPNDLVLRDMGYLSNKVLNMIAELEAWFITKIKDNYKYYLPNTDTEFDLAKELNKVSKRGQHSFIKELTIGKSKHLTATLVAVKLTKEQVDKRTKKYRKKNGVKQTMSKSKKQLLEWSIFATNIEKEKIDIEQMFTLYSLRWQIELMFKTWKSRFGIDTLLQKYTGNDPNKILILFYLSLIFCVCIFRPLFIKYDDIMAKKYDKTLSLQKFASMIINHLYELCKEDDLITKLVAKNACFDYRKDRLNHNDLLGSFYD